MNCNSENRRKCWNNLTSENCNWPVANHWLFTSITVKLNSVIPRRPHGNSPFQTTRPFFLEIDTNTANYPTPQKLQTTASIKAFFLSDLCLYVLYYYPPLFQEHEGKPLKLPFFTDLCLSLSLLTHSLLNVMYHGPANSQTEDACQHLLDSKLLQR